MESSTVTPGLPLDDHPGQLCVPKVSPMRAHSSMAYVINSVHLGLSTWMVGSVISASLPPMRNCCTPPRPARLKDSRSEVMPSLVTEPFIHCQKVIGLADSGGLRK